ncbi:hypothetical protein GQ457_03G035680 [Hibiscus cannabinus]
MEGWENDLGGPMMEVVDTLTTIGDVNSSRKRWALFKKEAWRWRWKFFGSAFKWKRLNIKLSFLDDVRFKIVSLLEADLAFFLSFDFCCMN